MNTNPYTVIRAERLGLLATCKKMIQEEDWLYSFVSKDGKHKSPSRYWDSDGTSIFLDGIEMGLAMRKGESK